VVLTGRCLPSRALVGRWLPSSASGSWWPVEAIVIEALRLSAQAGNVRCGRGGQGWRWSAGAWMGYEAAGTSTACSGARGDEACRPERDGRSRAGRWPRP